MRMDTGENMFGKIDRKKQPSKQKNITQTNLLSKTWALFSKF